MGDLTKNLSRHEFACKCGCGVDSMDFETVNVVQDVCDHFNSKVTITSAYRCLAYNRSPSVGSSDASQHPKARALDCEFDKATPETVHHYLTQKYPGKYGLGVYETFNHIDTRSGPPARW